MMNTQQKIETMVNVYGLLDQAMSLLDSVDTHMSFPGHAADQVSESLTAIDVSTQRLKEAIRSVVQSQ